MNLWFRWLLAGELRAWRFELAPVTEVVGCFGGALAHAAWSRRAFFLAIASLCLLAGPVRGQGVSIVVAADSEIESLSDRELDQIFTGRRLRWGSQRLHVVLNTGEPDEYARVIKTITGKTPRAFGLLWLQAGLDRSAPEPLHVDSEAQMLETVASTSGAIGYVLSSTPPPSVRVIYRSPSDDADSQVAARVAANIATSGPAQ